MWARALIVAVLTCRAVAVEAARTERHEPSLNGLVEVTVPLCFSAGLAGQIYWAGQRLGVDNAQALYLNEAEKNGTCSWERVGVPLDLVYECRSGYSYNCSAIITDVEDTTTGHVIEVRYILIWPE
jgi:hypothetical protein